MIKQWKFPASVWRINLALWKGPIPFAFSHGSVTVKVNKCLPSSCLFAPLRFLFTWNNPVPTVVGICAFRCYEEEEDRHFAVMTDAEMYVRAMMRACFSSAYPLDPFSVCVSVSPSLFSLECKHHPFWVPLYPSISTVVKRQRKRSSIPHFLFRYTHFFYTCKSVNMLSQGAGGQVIDPAPTSSWYPLRSEKGRHWR